MAKIVSNLYYGGLTVNKPFATLSSSDTWEFVTKVIFDDNYQWNPMAIFGFGTTDNKGFYGRISTNAQLQLFVSSDGSNWDICNEATGTDYLYTNTWYWLRYSYDGTSYKVDYSEDGTNWNNQITVTPAVATAMYVTDQKIYVGYRYDYQALSGQLNLSETKIKRNNSLFFDGDNYSTSGIINHGCTITGWVASGFSKEEYNEKYVDLNGGPYTENNRINFKAIIRAYYTEHYDSYYQDLISKLTDNDRNIGIDSYYKKFCFYNGEYNFFTNTVTNNSWYWIGWTWDGTEYKFYSLKDDGTYTSYKQLPAFNSWTLECTVTDSTNHFADGMRFGCNMYADDWNRSRFWRGSIDLGNTVMGDNVINWTVGKQGYITQCGCEAISQDTTKNITLVQGITFTVSPTPADATVTLKAPGYLQTDDTNSITAVAGTEISYTVTKPGYAKVTGTYTLTSSDYTLPIVMDVATDYVQPQIYDFGTWGTPNTLSVKTDNGSLSPDYEVYNCFNEDNPQGWHSSSTYTPFNIYMSLGQAVHVSEMSFINRTDDPSNPWPARGGVLYGSNDGENFNDIIATWTNNSWGAGDSWNFAVDDANAYSYLKLSITDASEYCCIKKIYITGTL